MFQERLSILWLKIKTNLLASVLGGMGIVLILIGFLSMLFSGSSREEIIFQSSKEASPSAKIFVDIQGAVVNPGVYQAPSDARLIDALALAGGLSAEADRSWVSRNLNLAVKLKDGTKIYIPRAGESVSQKTQNISGSANQIIGASEGLININTATISELDKLPGIGPVTGQKIIDNRPYLDINELVTKKVVGKKVFEQIKDKISAY